MSGLIGFHRMAAQRGDGLRPELLDLLISMQQTRAGVVDIGAVRGDGWVQSGPHPVGTTVSATAANVVALPSRTAPAPARSAQRSR